jgi:hypothetical protein
MGPLQGVEVGVVLSDRNWLKWPLKGVKVRSKQAGVSHYSLERTFFHSFRIQIRGFSGDTFFPVHVVRVELNLCHFPNEMFHTSVFLARMLVS